MIHILQCKNSTVTDFYLKVISEMFSISGFHCRFINMADIYNYDRNDLFVVSTDTDFVWLYNKGFKNIVLWVQGIAPEESYLKHKSILRYKILNSFSKFAIKHSLGVIYVSEKMKCFIENKFSITTTEKAFIMPCFNDTIEKASFFEPGKYKHNTFCYVGSLSKWQCFEKTVNYYKKIEGVVENTKLIVYTPEKEKAHSILSCANVQNYCVDFVAPSKLNSCLKNVKFGFILRDDIDVNRVATPTKISSYLAAGVIPIYSTCLADFEKFSAKMQYVVPVNNVNAISPKLIKLCENDINCNDVYNEYLKVFETYYSPEYYIKSSVTWTSNILKHGNFEVN